MKLKDIFVRLFGAPATPPAQKEAKPFRPRAGYEDLHDFLTGKNPDNKTEAKAVNRAALRGCLFITSMETYFRDIPCLTIKNKFVSRQGTQT